MKLLPYSIVKGQGELIRRSTDMTDTRHKSLVVDLRVGSCLVKLPSMERRVKKRTSDQFSMQECDSETQEAVSEMKVDGVRQTIVLSPTSVLSR